MSAEPGSTRLGHALGNAAVGDAVAADSTDDRTLRAVSGELDRTAFPDTAQGSRLVLYQTEDGGLDLRWHLDPVALAHARAAFGTAVPLLALMRLLRVHDGGKAEIIADAPLPSDESIADGVARYDKGGEGLLMAEIGLTSASGGWVLVARSNRLQAVRPVGALFLQVPPAVDNAALPSNQAPDRQPAPQAPQAGASSSLLPTLSPSRLAPEFPLVSAPAREAVGKLAPAVLPGRHSTAPAGNDMSAFILASAAPIQQWPRQIEPDDAAPVNPSGGTQPVRPPADVIGRVEPRLDARERLNAGAVDTAAFNQVEDDHRAYRQAARIPVAAGAVEPVPDLALAAVDDGAVNKGAVDAVPDGMAGNASGQTVDRIRAGSGPIRRARADIDAEIHAELLVYGSGTPGMMLDLGGHRYEIGRGGRFSFRLPINDPGLILVLLSTLPALPVAARDGEDGDSNT